MLDFVSVKTVREKTRTVISPEFKVKRSKDLMIRGHAFYAVWDEVAGFWSLDEGDVQRLVDDLLRTYAEEHKELEPVDIRYMRDFSSNKWLEWQKYCRSLPDNYHDLDDKVLFSNSEIKKTDYATKCLTYPLLAGKMDAYEEMMNVLYAPEERQKIEWGIGAVISGDSKRIQKFMVLYGGPGTGKSTILNLIQDMFPGYWSLFEAKALTSGSDFGLESLKNNTLLAIQHDGDLSKIDDNTLLNSVVSHEEVVVNEKHKSKYTMQFHSMLWIGTNKAVKITDSKSGITRRLIDIHPTGQKINRKRYDRILNQLKFEFGAIAHQCLSVYQKLGPTFYDGYVAEDMIMKTNDFYNFVMDNYELFEGVGEDGISMSVLWRRYKEYCEDANVSYPMPMRIFKDEMKNYFEGFEARVGNRYSIYYGFIAEKFKGEQNGGVSDVCDAVPAVGSVASPLEENKEVKKNAYNSGSNEDYSCGMVTLSSGDLILRDLEGPEKWLNLTAGNSLLDRVLADCPAQYATKMETPGWKWESCKTKLRDLDTKKLHYVRPPENLIVIDFDLKDEKGEKCFQRNLEAASKWPPTYAECSKSGSGIHLHYWFQGDVGRLARAMPEDPNIEIKVFSGLSSLRRIRSKCNDVDIAEMHSGLPFRKEKKVFNGEVIKSERSLRELIQRNLRKEIHPATKPSMDFIAKILEDAQNTGLHYDVRDLRPAIQSFAMKSTHNADYCMRLLSRMPFCSEESSENAAADAKDIEKNLVFFDVEVFPNLFLICFKKRGSGNSIVNLFNPSPEEVERITGFPLVGFNNRKYDNHMCYGAMMGYSPLQIFKLSQRIIVEQDREAFFGEAYNLSYTDVYDFLSAPNKMSLKKWEIKLHIHHQEFDWPWDKPIPKELWPKAAEYCGYDVLATEAVFEANQADWLARKILAEWAGMTPNDTTNSLTTRLIVGKDPNPQKKFIYTDLSTIFPGYQFSPYGIPKEAYKPGAKIVGGKSIYLGEDPGEGGRVFAKPGMYRMVPVLDVESMHPRSIIELKYFGEEYTKRFEEIVDTRLNVKHGNYEDAKAHLPEVLYKYFEDETSLSGLGGAIKTPINSTYGLTSAKFPNKLKDPRNVDNIVAKRGALFMMLLQKEAEKKGFTVAHVKTDSIKIPEATDEIVQFVIDFGKKYGYTFDKECVYARMCLVNESTYIALVCEEKGKKVKPYWTATGEQFQVPYVFKTLFSKEPLEFYDLCETKSVSTAMYLDFTEGKRNVTEEETVKQLRWQIRKDAEKRLRKIDQELLDKYADVSQEELEQRIAEGHDYKFVGKVGLFCPMKDGVGGGVLVRKVGDDIDSWNAYSAVTGTKRPDGTPYRWMDAEVVKELGLEDQIDRSYYDYLVDEAVAAISKYGDFEWFSSMDTYDWLEVSEEGKDEVPFDTTMNAPEELPFT